MELSDFEGNYEVRSKAELDAILLRRWTSDGAQFNSFWMVRDDEEFPLFSLLVRDDLAHVWFSPEEYHPGFIPVGTVQSLDPNGMTMFRLNTQEQPIPNDRIVSFAEARDAAREFFRTDALPRCVNWFEL